MKPSGSLPAPPPLLPRLIFSPVVGAMLSARLPLLLLLCIPLAFTACRDAKVAAYRIPKEHDTPPPAPAGAAVAMPDTGGLAVASTDGGGLTWTAPASWKPKPGSAMRKGSYAIGPEAGPVADLAITAFPGDVGDVLANVNRWRAQLSLPPIAEGELVSQLTPLAVPGLDMKVVDLAGGTKEAPLRMLGAIVPQGNATWFFKLTGPDALVAQEKPAFLAFLQTVKLSAQPLAAPVEPAAVSAAATATAPANMSGSPVAAATGSPLKWSAPPRWQEKPGTATRKATFVIPGANGATAELAVTAFPGNVGGELANLNRWRGQLSLPPISEAEFPAAVTRLNVNGLAITVADLTATGENPQRLLGAMVPHAGATWFFKLTGPAAVVADEKPAFLAFLQTLSAP